MLWVKPVYEGKREDDPNCLGTYSCSYMKADIINENNRRYSRGIMVNRILTPKTMKQLKNKLLLGEIDHPADRFNTNMEKVAICTTDLYYDEDKQELMGTFDVLNTPCGRIVKTILEYGSVIGISARSLGTSKKTKECEVLDEDTYVFKTFDMVVEPGFATSTIDGDKQELKESLNLLLESLDESERQEASEVVARMFNEHQEVINTNEGDEESITPTYESTFDLERELNEALLEGDNESVLAINEYANAYNSQQLIYKDALISELTSKCEGLQAELEGVANQPLNESFEKEYNESLDYISNLEGVIQDLRGQMDRMSLEHSESIKSLNESHKEIISKISNGLNSKLSDSEIINESLMRENRQLRVTIKQMGLKLSDNEPQDMIDINNIVSVVSINESKQEAPIKKVDALTSKLCKSQNI